MATLSNPSIAAFKTQFARNFPYNSDPTLGVTDDDIGAAYLRVNATINPRMFGLQETYNLGYLSLAAHYLVLSLQQAAQSVIGGNSFLETAKSAGGVSQSFAIPEAYMKNPLWAAFAATTYGRDYLMQLMPGLAGQVFTVRGTTQP